MEEIQYVGIDLLDEGEMAILNKLSVEYYDTIKRELKNVTSLKIHIKTYDDKHESGKARKFSIHVQAIAPTRIFESTKAADWDLARTLHKAFKDIELEIQHRLHTDDQHNRSR